MKCPNCSTLLEEDDLFCPVCGKKVEQKKRKSNLAVILTASVILLAIVAGIAVWLLKSPSDETGADSGEISEMQQSSNADEKKEGEVQSSPLQEAQKGKKEKDIDKEVEGAVKESKTKEKTETEKKEEAREKEEPEVEKESDTGYILPESSSRILTASDITGLSIKELNYARNEIYARHGRKFKSAELQNYFNGQSWYQGKYDPDDFEKNYSASVISDIERQNAEFLKTQERKIAPSGYQLDQ